MGQITLVVTRAELNHFHSGHPDEAQIAIRQPSPDIAATIRSLTVASRKQLVLGGCVAVVAADPGELRVRS